MCQSQTAAIARLPTANRGGWILFSAVLVWAYGSPMAGLAFRWWNEPDYFHGFLVPVFAVVLLWNRRQMLESFVPQGSSWGLALFALSAAMRWASAYFYFRLLDPLSLVPCLAGVALFVGGWRALRWAGPSIVFLVFMIPAPGLVADLLSHPLQRIGTVASTYILQTCGVAAVSQGNVILLTEGELGVADACSGLRMMMLFFAVCVGAVLMMKLAWWEKVVIVLSAVPIAVVANVIRITATGVLYQTASSELAEAMYHDLAGWFMMPLAVALLWGEMGMISRLFPAPKRGR
jgi:exosortase